MTAPAAAPIAASRCVCFTVTDAGAEDVTAPPLDVVTRPLPLLELLRLIVLRVVELERAGERDAGDDFAANPASAGEIES
jgi:hypothetical protein